MVKSHHNPPLALALMVSLFKNKYTIHATKNQNPLIYRERQRQKERERERAHEMI
ncbi:hypothetical protein HYC85_024466 [Camellia sinensis]|uniref:Uncharacterized protein n=1 Tax=Camellia sinensis TaxID=4442 RepID=A0A7J7G866_CAMSI|nr:hypothetical protein HYC85_024466 [Camellia sinensis]